jgi:class 3 adenylate cyclase
MREHEPTAPINLGAVKSEFLKYAPAYAMEEAKLAIDKIADLQSQGVIRSGLYYVVLVDVVGSAKFTAEHGNKLAIQRIEYFISSSFRALNSANIKNIALFVKEIGDAVLFIFQHFPDILRWRAELDELFRFLDGTPMAPMRVRTCVHLGEVYLDGVNPLSLAVSQCFKMEKRVGPDEIVLTEGAFQVAWPTLARAYHGFANYGTVELDGFPAPVPLHKLTLTYVGELRVIVAEELG